MIQQLPGGGGSGLMLLFADNVEFPKNFILLFHEENRRKGAE
jgi:hypothetical protein